MDKLTFIAAVFGSGTVGVVVEKLLGVFMQSNEERRLRRLVNAWEDWAQKVRVVFREQGGDTTDLPPEPE